MPGSGSHLGAMETCQYNTWWSGRPTMEAWQAHHVLQQQQPLQPATTLQPVEIDLLSLNFGRSCAAANAGTLWHQSTTKERAWRSLSQRTAAARRMDDDQFFEAHEDACRGLLDVEAWCAAMQKIWLADVSVSDTISCYLWFATDPVQMNQEGVLCIA